jgi:hypothetical protein
VVRTEKCILIEPSDSDWVYSRNPWNYRELCWNDLGIFQGICKGFSIMLLIILDRWDSRTGYWTVLQSRSRKEMYLLEKREHSIEVRLKRCLGLESMNSR